ncbi:MAG: hypothetical protein WBZ36_14765 [Candidatus Nitrosopolaris sp.]
MLAHEFELEFAHANEFVNTYNGDGVKIVVSFSKTNLPDKDAILFDPRGTKTMSGSSIKITVGKICNYNHRRLDPEEYPK